MSKILLHIAYPLWRKNALVGYARALQLRDEGHDVTVTYCSAKGGTCVSNHTGNPIVCGMCRSSVRQTLDGLKLHSIGLVDDSLDTKDEIKPPSISSRKELLEGVLSGLISTFRLLPGDIKRHPLIRALKRRSYQTALRMLSDVSRVMQTVRPDRFEVFNGRHGCSKFGLIAAEKLGIPFNTLEVTTAKRPIVYHGHTAHDRIGVQKRIRSLPIDMELAEKFFRSRLQRKSNKFAKNQSSSFEVPSSEGFDRMVSIFLSSQDEFESLGASWRTTFPPDHDVIRESCEAFPDTLFCIRFHPNQAGIKSDIQSGFDCIKDLPNARIYGPRDEANTYQLIEHSDLVVAFNSTVAVEACWAEKPAIILGPSFYDTINVAYTPADLAAFHDLMRRKDLQAFSREGAAQLAYFELADGTNIKYLRQVDGNLVDNGFKRKKAWQSVVARHTSTVCHEVAKLFVRAA